MAAPSFVKQSAVASVTSGTATSAFSGGNTALNSIVAIACGYSATGSDFTNQFSDTAGNVYKLVASFRSVGGGCAICIFLCASCKAGANSLQLTQPTGASRWILYGQEYAPLLAGDAASVVTQTIAPTTSPSTNVIPSKVDELVLWACDNAGGGFTPSAPTAGFTLRVPGNHQIFMDNAGSPSAAGSRTIGCTTSLGANLCSVALAFSVPIQPVRISSTFADTLAQFDGLKFMLAPVQALLSDRVIQQDNTIAYINGGSFGDQLQQIDLLRFALIGAAAQQLFISEDLLMQDGIINPNVRLTQASREVVVLPTSGMNVRYTQAGREVILTPTAGVNVRVTQAGREVIIATPEAIIADGNYLMTITEDLSTLTTDTVSLTMPGQFLKIFSEHILTNLADQDTNVNVKVKKNPVIKASTFVTADTSLNHWQDAIFMTPFNAALALADSMTTLADSIASRIPVTLTASFADQTPAWADAAPVFQMVMLERFIQNLNFWQEFYAPQPFLGIFNESTGDQWQDSLATFMPYFMPLSDSFTLTDSLTLPIGQAYSDSLTLTDSETALLADLMSLVDALSLADSLAFNNPQAYADSLTMTDSFTIAEALDELFSDSINNWADSIAEVLGTSSFQDQLVLSDALAIGYGNALPDTLTLTDSDALLFGMGMNIAEQFLFNDQFGEFPNGLLIIDQLQMSDTIQFPVWLALADQLVQVDSLGAGYGNVETDTNTMADSMRLLESFEVMLQDASPAQLDSLNTLFSFLLAIDDQVFMIEQLYIMYGLLVNDQLSQSDAEINVVAIVLPNLDDDIANWLDAILTELIFAPTDVVVRDIRVLAQMVNTFIIQAQQQADNAVVQPKTTQVNSIEILDVIE